VIDVPFSAEDAVKGAEAIAAFRAAVTWLPAFARTIRRVEIEGDAPVPPPFNALVRASEADHYADGGLSEPATLAKVWDWPTLTELQNRIIASEVAGQLRKLGFGNTRPLRFSSLLRRQIGERQRVDPELAKTLGPTVTPRSIRETPLDNELHEIPDIARQHCFSRRTERGG
jgi:hypothetical protein